MQQPSLHSLLDSKRPLILDGGLGSELAASGYDLSSPLWSAQLVTSQPDAIVATHRAYLDAGARIIISASYQASIAGLETAGLDSSAVKAVFTRTTELACRAREEFLRDNPDCGYVPLVAASVGPYGAQLADGSEYRGDYGVDAAQLRRFHAQRLQWLDDSGADLLACETIPDIAEARVLAQLLASVRTPCWVSFCCRDERQLQDGNSLRDALALFQDQPGVVALGVNCCAPALVEGLIAGLQRGRGDRLIVVYPDSGAKYDSGRKRWRETETPGQWAQRALGWHRAGADIIGGCCRVGPEHIRQLSARDTWRY